MMNAISSSMSMYSSMQRVQGPPPKKPEELFSVVDSNQSGGIDQSELEALAEKISEETGQTIDTENAIANYDADADGVLSMAELQNLMMESGLEPPEANVSMAMDAYGKNGPPPMQGPPPPKPEELFAETDSNEDGTIDQDELDALAEKIAEATGQTIDTETAIADYDADGDGSLNQEELQSLMEDNMPAPPPPPSFSQYATNSYQDQDTLTKLLEALQNETTGATSLFDSVA